MTTNIKSQTNKLDRNCLYKTENECRLRGLDMTPDMLLNEPIAISLSDDDDVKCNQNYTATSYTGSNDNGIRVLNWIESKAMFGGPEQLHTAMKRQLFPYWNRHGPGAVIYWFGHVLEKNGKEHSISTNQLTSDIETTTNVNSLSKVDSCESSAFKFWSKYCLLMDGFPSTNRVVMYNHRNTNRHNSNIKKKTFPIETIQL